MKKIVATLAVTCFLASAVVLAADKASSAYRRYLMQSGITFGTC